MPTPSAMDAGFYQMARQHIDEFRAKWQHDTRGWHPILEVGPQVGSAWPGAETLDIVPGCTHQGDITTRTHLSSMHYSLVVAMDVLEHTVDPFAAVRELERILKWGGVLIASAPWNFRVHNPLPDLWRFNSNTWKLLLRNFRILEMDVLDTPDRPLMPIHINVAAQRMGVKPRQPVVFERIER